MSSVKIKFLLFFASCLNVWKFWSASLVTGWSSLGFCGCFEERSLFCSPDEVTGVPWGIFLIQIYCHHVFYKNGSAMMVSSVFFPFSSVQNETRSLNDDCQVPGSHYFCITPKFKNSDENCPCLRVHLALCFRFS